MKDRFLHEPLSNIYRLQTRFGARQCFYMHVSFCSRGEGETGGVSLYEGGLCQGEGDPCQGKGALCQERGVSVRGRGSVRRRGSV